MDTYWKSALDLMENTLQKNVCYIIFYQHNLDTGAAKSRTWLSNWTELNPNIKGRWPVQRGFHGGSVVKDLPAKAGDAGSIPGWGGSLEEEMATHSSILAWRIPRTEEPGVLQSMESQRVRHDWVTEQPPPIQRVPHGQVDQLCHIHILATWPWIC